ncbi:MAG: hypothetical protein EOO02_21185, partial [Chitinophagaceae bacterium]
MSTRRDFIKQSSVLSAAFFLPNDVLFQSKKNIGLQLYTLRGTISKDPKSVLAQVAKLGYTYDALAPNIQPGTMEVHYSKHYKKYTDELNKAVKGTPLETQTIEQILTKLDPNNKPVRNNGGGYYNHTLFWEV